MMISPLREGERPSGRGRWLPEGREGVSEMANPSP